MKMASVERNLRVKRQLVREASIILKEELKDPRIGFVTVTDATISPDLRHAKLFVSILGSSAEQAETLKALSHAAGFVRAEVGKRIRLRYTPEITFVQDTSAQYADHIFRLIDELHEKE
jgi:ribosome-binding factor A